MVVLEKLAEIFRELGTRCDKKANRKENRPAKMRDAYKLSMAKVEQMNMENDRE